MAASEILDVTSRSVAEQAAVITVVGTPVLASWSGPRPAEYLMLPDMRGVDFEGAVTALVRADKPVGFLPIALGDSLGIAAWPIMRSGAALADRAARSADRFARWRDCFQLDDLSRVLIEGSALDAIVSAPALAEWFLNYQPLLGGYGGCGPDTVAKRAGARVRFGLELFAGSTSGRSGGLSAGRREPVDWRSWLRYEALPYALFGGLGACLGAWLARWSVVPQMGQRAAVGAILGAFVLFLIRRVDEWTTWPRLRRRARRKLRQDGRRA